MSSVTQAGHRLSIPRGHPCPAWPEAPATSESGGALFTPGAAHRLADPVIVVALIAPGGPPSDRAEHGGQKPGIRQKPGIQVTLWLAWHAPALAAVQRAAQGRAISDPARPAPRDGQDTAGRLARPADRM
jgi:hypothetical protein